MAPIRLTPEERLELTAIARKTRDARVLRRAQVLLDLDRGASAATLAERFQVSRSTIYNWIGRFRGDAAGGPSLTDRPRPGRPSKRGAKPGPAAAS